MEENSVLRRSISTSLCKKKMVKFVATENFIFLFKNKNFYKSYNYLQKVKYIIII